MKISVDRITESPKESSFAEASDDLNLIYSSDEVRDFRFPPFLDVRVVYYRSGRELFFRGEIEGTVEGCCSRCLKNYAFRLKKEFSFVLTPDPLSTKGRELNREELGLSYYSAEEIHLSPYIREQVLLALPIRPLCGDGCRGLCMGCGADLNEEPCRCPASEEDPRLAIFRTLKLGQ